MTKNPEEEEEKQDEAKTRTKVNKVEENEKIKRNVRTRNSKRNAQTVKVETSHFFLKKGTKKQKETKIE